MYCTFDGLHISLRIGNNKRGSIDVSRNLLPQIDDDLRFSLKPTFGCKHTITILAVATSCTMTIARYPFFTSRLARGRRSTIHRGKVKKSLYTALVSLSCMFVTPADLP